MTSGGAGPRTNRVTPLGDLVATRARGLVFGNRGCLHDGQGAVRRRFAGERWIACRLEFRGRRRTPLMQPGRYTELFFLDEATAWAAGHRPCAECRRDDWNRFRALWAAEFGEDRADRVDARLHGERLDPGTGRTRLHRGPFDELPVGAFVLIDSEPCLVLADSVLAWSSEGYRPARPGRPVAARSSR